MQASHNSRQPSSSAGYAAALFDYFGFIISRPFYEDDTHWYFEAGVRPVNVCRSCGSVSNRYVPFMWLRESYSGKVLSDSDGRPNGWSTGGPNARYFLEDILPYLQYKRQEVVDALAQYELSLAKQEGVKTAYDNRRR